ncbi:hypothetical protein [Streptomyces ortus]|uniref:Uncharacterized protein n=1 Tax=Streptomyces ortus TaxID=2867268 RepID=A0ABT3V516_9ACTN|nr:hypothetical protein [Streptomyces ortus]MCX4234737.1 hypothetical protein [Streptomyces ortus]
MARPRYGLSVERLVNEARGQRTARLGLRILQLPGGGLGMVGSISLSGIATSRRRTTAAGVRWCLGHRPAPLDRILLLTGPPRPPHGTTYTSTCATASRSPGTSTH